MRKRSPTCGGTASGSTARSSSGTTRTRRTSFRARWSSPVATASTSRPARVFDAPPLRVHAAGRRGLHGGLLEGYDRHLLRHRDLTGRVWPLSRRVQAAGPAVGGCETAGPFAVGGWGEVLTPLEIPLLPPMPRPLDLLREGAEGLHDVDQL